MGENHNFFLVIIFFSNSGIQRKPFKVINIGGQGPSWTVVPDMYVCNIWPIKQTNTIKPLPIFFVDLKQVDYVYKTCYEYGRGI